MGKASTTDYLIKAASRESLSEVLPTTLSAARRIGDEEFIRWARLESSGYYPDNPGAEEDSRVPDYRKVRGRYLNEWKKPISLPPEVGKIVNQQTLRQPAGTVEEFAAGDDPIIISDPTVEQLLDKYLGVKPAAFYFRPEAAADVVHAIRNRLIEKLEDRREELDEIHLPQLASDEGKGGGEGVWGFMFGSVWRVVLLVIAGLIVAFLSWHFGWTESLN